MTFKEGFRNAVLPTILVSGAALGFASRSNDVEAKPSMWASFRVGSECLEPNTDRARIRMKIAATGLPPDQEYGVGIFQVKVPLPGPFPFEQGTIVKKFPLGTTEFDLILDDEYSSIDGKEREKIKPESHYDITVRLGPGFSGITGPEVVDYTPKCPGIPAPTNTPTSTPIPAATPWRVWLSGVFSHKGW